VKQLLLVCGLAALAISCNGGDESGRGAAEAFLDAHYVRIDLDAARNVTSGLALSKIEKELALTDQIAIAQDTLKPRINYALETARESEDRGQYAYTLTIRAPGLEPFTKLVTVSVRRGDGSWSVTNYTEGDPALDAGSSGRPASDR